MGALRTIVAQSLLGLLLAGSALAVEGPGRKGSTPRPAPAASVEPAAGKEPTGRGRGKHVLRGVVNLNQADEATLELLPGVGPATAQKIVALRQKRPFKRVEDVTRVKGIGKKKLASMKPFLSVSGPSTLVEEDAVAEEE